MELRTTFTVERRFRAAPEKVWAAWTDPALLSAWYNPHPGMTCVVHETDLRVGGTYRRSMPNPDGGEHVDEGVFFVVDGPTRLVQGTPDQRFLIETVLAPDGGGTRMTVGMVGVPVESNDHMAAAWGAGFDKLAALLGEA